MQVTILSYQINDAVSFKEYLILVAQLEHQFRLVSTNLPIKKNGALRCVLPKKNTPVIQYYILLYGEECFTGN